MINPQTLFISFCLKVLQIAIPGHRRARTLRQWLTKRYLAAADRLGEQKIATARRLQKRRDELRAARRYEQAAQVKPLLQQAQKELREAGYD